MEAVLYIIIGVAAGYAVAYFMNKSKQQALVAGAEKRARSDRESLQAAVAEAQRRLAVAESQLQMLREHHAQELQKQASQEAALREELRKQTEERVRLMSEEMKTMANTLFAQSRELFNKADRERLEAVLAPFNTQLATFRATVEANSKQTLEGKTELKTTFEQAMKQLHDEQERTVNALKEQTERIGNDAASLTQALKGDSKMQGDWGEMILEKTLEDCGLEKDKQFFLQQNYKDEAGNNYRPDAVVEFPNGERTVIDSKVSLTAYHEAVNAGTPEERERHLKEHVASVRRHIDELEKKNYDRLVPGCIGYVLMFVPYESGYSAALRTDPSLLQYAYKNHIILLSPSNLLMALQLTNTMWQNYRLNKNVDEILNQANALYDKFVGFADTFLKIESDIQHLQNTYEKAKGQLREGPGNVIRRLDKIKGLGISPKKQIPEQLSGTAE